MSADAWIGLAAIVVTVFLTLGAALIVHIRHDERRETRLEAVEKEIGTREIGMRGAIHEHGNALSWLGGCVWFIAAKIGIDLPKRDK